MPALVTAAPASPTPKATPLRPARACPTVEGGGLITELARLEAGMPGPDSQGMPLPSPAEMQVFTAVLQALAANDPVSACTWLAEHGLPFDVVDFTDLPFQRQGYWLLREIQPVTLGWGTFVIRQGGSRPLVIEVPHPQADARTRSEGVTLLRELEARALLVAGAHRCANADYASCGGTTIACGQLEPYRTSDVAHADRNVFQIAHMTLAGCGSGVVSLQLHGNSLNTCPDLFISNGTTHPGDLANRVYDQARLACRDYTVDLADGEAGECEFLGNGVQAAYSLGCTVDPARDACLAPVSRPRGPDTYLSLEQSWEFRQDYACLVRALKATWDVEE